MKLSNPRNIHLSQNDQVQLLRTVLERAPRLRLTVTGPSMTLTIDSGDAVEVRPFSGRLGVGEIALFQAPGGRIFAHRLMRLEQGAEGPQYFFKGDGLTLGDEAVGGEQIIGRVTAVWHRQSAFPVRLPLTFPGLTRILAWYHRLRPWTGLAWRKISA